jgi:anti-anti-sigma factor
MLSVSIENQGEVVILDCLGRIVRGEETAILCAAVKGYGRNVVLDLSKVESIDAAGVGALISLQAAGIYLHLKNPSKAVREVLQVTHLESVFEIETRSSESEIVEGAPPHHDSPSPAQARVGGTAS